MLTLKQASSVVNHARKLITTYDMQHAKTCQQCVKSCYKHGNNVLKHANGMLNLLKTY